MKRLFILGVLLFTFSVANSQSKSNTASIFLAKWIYFERGNNFDGKHKVCSISEDDSVESYKNRTASESGKVALWIYQKGNVAEFRRIILRQTGFASSAKDTTVKFYLDDSELIYSTDNIKILDNSDIIIWDFEDPKSDDPSKRLINEEILVLFKQYNKITMRVSNSEKSEDYVFTLRGSTEAINKIFPDLNERIKAGKSTFY